MKYASRASLCVGLLGFALVGELGLDRLTACERPPLKAPLATLPRQIGTWVGQDVEMDPEILRQSQADEYVNRVYYDRSQPGRQVSLWINYSRLGLNMRHSPEVCLPSGGWEKEEALCRVASISRTTKDLGPLTISSLVYSQRDRLQTIGFWYYVFGEGWWERHLRNMAITSRSSHGRTTKGSGMTVEIFVPSDSDPDGRAVDAFAQALLPELDKLLPNDPAPYYIP